MTWKFFGVPLIAGVLGTQTICPPPPHRNIVLSATSLQFSPQIVTQGSNLSTAQDVTVTSTGSAGVAISSIAVSGYYSETNNCPVAPNLLAVGASCTINVSFAPPEVGQFNGVVTISDTAIGAPHLVSLIGSGVPPVGFSPSSLDFGSVAVGDNATRPVTLTNNQKTALTFNGVSGSGDYAASSNCPASITAGGTCTISVTFAPTAVASIPGAITVATGALPATQPIGVSGTGTGSGTPNVSFSDSILDFGSQEAGTASATKSVMVTNTSTSVTVSFTAVAASGSAYQVSNDTCSGQTLSPSHTCSFKVSFHPVANFAAINYPGAVTVTDSDATSPQVVGLSGMGVPALVPSPSSVNFGNLNTGASSSTQAVSVSNHDSASETIAPISIAGDFSLDANNNTCSSSVSAGGTCSFAMTFNPRKLGPSMGAATIMGSSGGFLNPQVVNLAGCQTDIAVAPGSLNFGIEAVGVTSGSEFATVTNGDGNPLNISGTSTRGANASDFTVANDTCGASLASGSSCTIQLNFTPGASGRRTGVLNINDDGFCSPQYVNLLGGDPGPYTLTATTVGTGTGTITGTPAGIACGSAAGSCTASYNRGTSVTLTAAADANNAFVGWGEACSGTGSCTVDMQADKQVSAQFTSTTVSVSKSGNGTGRVTSTPPGIDCGSTCTANFPVGSTVTLAEIPDQGSVFEGWGGACTGSGPCAVTITENQNVIANFGIPGYSVSASAATPSSVLPGQSSTASVTVTSANAFSSPVALSCSVQPTGSLAPKCGFNPSSVTPPADGSISATLTISTTGATAMLPSPRPAPLYALWLSASGLALVGVGSLGDGRKRKRALLLLAAAVTAAVMLQNACGGGGTSTSQQQQQQSGTPAGAYTVTVTAVSGNLQQTTSVNLNVQ